MGSLGTRQILSAVNCCFTTIAVQAFHTDHKLTKIILLSNGNSKLWTHLRQFSALITLGDFHIQWEVEVTEKGTEIQSEKAKQILILLLGCTELWTMHMLLTSFVHRVRKLLQVKRHIF
jgi:hypothetical protein